MTSRGFATRWASPPGNTISEVINEQGLAPELVASGVGLSEDEFRELLSGETSIDLAMARALSECIGATAAFWLARETQYREDLGRVEADRWSAQLPLKQMCEFGWIKTPSNWRERIDFSLGFFDVADVSAWDRRYASQVEDAHFRTSPTFEHQVEATAVWFRAAELSARQIALVSEFRPEGFMNVLGDLRKLTRQADPNMFLPELTARCASAGVRLAVVRAPQGCTASGATRTFEGSPLITLSARHLTDDHFWFTFFHEAGHTVMHDLTAPFIDADEVETSEAEVEANAFATRLLLGDHPLNHRPKSHRDVISVSHEVGVSPGIIVGQLQHSGHLRRNEYNSLKRRFRWDGTSLEKERRR